MEGSVIVVIAFWGFCGCVGFLIAGSKGAACTLILAFLATIWIVGNDN